MWTLASILALNATSCILFGALFVLLPGAVAAFLGAPPAPAWVIMALGAALIGHGLHLAHSARRGRPPRALVLYFSGGDFAWVIGTVTLVAAGLWIDTPAGIAAAAIVALGVGAMGALQLLALRRAARAATGTSSRPRLRGIDSS